MAVETMPLKTIGKRKERGRSAVLEEEQVGRTATPLVMHWVIAAVLSNVTKAHDRAALPQWSTE